jgi:hypothetical protein
MNTSTGIPKQVEELLATHRGISQERWLAVRELRHQRSGF